MSYLAVGEFYHEICIIIYPKCIADQSFSADISCYEFAGKVLSAAVFKQEFMTFYLVQPVFKSVEHFCTKLIAVDCNACLVLNGSSYR